MVRLEREVIERVSAGSSVVAPIAEYADPSRYPQLGDNQKRQAILRAVLATQDQFVALQGTAGSAKSTAAGILREIAEEHGFRVKGLAPTGKARDALLEKGIPSETLQLHLIRARGENRQLALIRCTSLMKRASPRPDRCAPFSTRSVRRIMCC